MAESAKRNDQARPIIVKKIVEGAHAGHHGGAWKVAYADFVTAMMAFFLLMWLIGATNEKQRKALADYFAPTLVTQKQDAAGASGFFSGDSLIAKDNYAHSSRQTGSRSLTIPKDASGGQKEMAFHKADFHKFSMIAQNLMLRIKTDVRFRTLTTSLKFTLTRDGMRIDLIDQSNFSMFDTGTDRLTPRAIELLSVVGDGIKSVPNKIIIRGHTDAMPYGPGSRMSNWALSAERAEATRAFLSSRNIGDDRMERIEGVADQDLIDPGNPLDPTNRRMSITLGWKQIR